MSASAQAFSADPGLPDSVFTWRFEVQGGDSWGGRLIADSSLFSPGAIVAAPFGVYTILTEEERGMDLTPLGLEDGQVFVEWYWHRASGQFLPTRNGSGTASGTAGLGTERDFAWSGTGWAAFGAGGAQQIDAVRLATARFTWVFEADSGDRWSGVLFELGTAYDIGSTLRTAHGTYRVSGEAALAEGELVPIGTVRLTGGYFDRAGQHELRMRETGGTIDHGTAGLGSELGAVWDGAVWVPFGQGGALQADAVVTAAFEAPRFSVANFGASPQGGGWTSQNLFPRVVADVDGDGRADILGFGFAGAWLATADAERGFASPRLAVANFGASPGGGGWTSYDVFPRMPGDVNGDGIADIVGFGWAGVWVATADGEGGFEPMRFAVNNFGFSAGGGGWSSQTQFPRLLGDVNGDGRADVVGFGWAGVWLSTGNAEGGFDEPRFVVANFGFSAGGGGWTSQEQFPRILADVNGDGRADIVGFGWGGVWVSTADDRGGFDTPRLAIGQFGVSAAAGGWSGQNAMPRMLGDVNGDGLADIVGFGPGGTWVATANLLGGFDTPRLVLAAFGSSAQAGGWTSQDLYPRLVADMNGDGRADIAGFGPNGVSVADALAVASLL